MGVRLSQAPSGPRKANSVDRPAGVRTVPARCLGRAAGTSRAAGRAVQVGDAEGQVQGLAAVEPGVARGLVPLAQVGFGDVHAAADALGDVVAGELDVDAARMRAERAVHLEAARALLPP